MEQQKWIGIFQAEWPVQCHTINSCIMLAEQGFCVDLFLYNTPVFIELAQTKKITNINIHDLSKYPNNLIARKNLFSRIIHGISWRWQIILNKIHEIYLLKYKDANDKILYFFIPDDITQQVYSIIGEKYYQCLIGVEKLGLVWAGSIGNKRNIPYAYHSLELYTKDHPIYNKSLKNKILKKAEEKYHQQSNFTIIQDPQRAEILLQDNGVSKTTIAYLPISLLGGIYQGKSDEFKHKLNNIKNSISILQFGQIARFGLELAQVAQEFPPEWKLIIHDGLAISQWNDNELVKKIQTIDVDRRIKLSLDKLEAQQIKQLVASTHIGLVLYYNSCKNDALTIFASEKLALYLQCGVPIIAFNYPGYEIVEKFNFGVLINSIEDLPNAIRKIIINYDLYSVNAHNIFKKFYSFEENFFTVIKVINNLSNLRC
ncbi:glycosyl transferase [Calothrix sp. PCC 7507]|uniref:glycosyl transferase n=1 Tax=Calothrix sp. PCC 7507 TaxID=99598 RepID=UPI00029F1712|nr:glycosyl transferase [Calothrix sp. PCC 7507]AFY36214.1 glycosyltransferase [Calothrix sp. PCC 7507]